MVRMSDEERLRRQRVRDVARREKARAAKIAEGTYREPSPTTLAKLRETGFQRKDGTGTEELSVTEQDKRDTERRKLVYLAHLERGQRRTAAMNATNIPYYTLRYWRAHDPEFVEAELRAEESCAEQIEDALFASAMSGNTNAQVYWLNNRAPKRWRDAKSKVEVEVKHTGQIEAGERLTKLGELLSRVEARALGPGPQLDIIDVDAED